MKADSLEFKL